MSTAPQSLPANNHGDLFGHPKGLYVLFFSEMWERFSYYGMRALLTLYMVKVLKYEKEFAVGTYAAYIGFVYATPIIGGALADRFLGARRAIVMGGIIMSFGHFAMAIETPFFFYTAMALIITGNGFFKPNVSTLVGTLYKKGDPRRDGAFTIFYMGINIGAFLAPLACSLLADRIAYRWGFTLAGFGMLVGLAIFLWGQKLLGNHGLPPREEALWERSAIGIPKMLLLYLGIFLFVPVAAYLLVRPAWVDIGVHILGPLVVAYIVYESIRCTAAERGRLFVLMILIFFSITFWSCFEQAGSSMTLFTDEHIDLVVLGFEVPVAALQAVNPFFIVLLGIPFAWMWASLGRAGRDPSSPLKFSLGILQLGLGFVALVFAAKETVNGGKASILWMVLAYFFHTTGELCLSPVGLSTVTKMSPVRLVGLMMGVWFLSNAFAGVLSGVIAKATTGDAGYEEVFQNVFYFAMASGGLLLVLVPALKWLGPEEKQNAVAS